MQEKEQQVHDLIARLGKFGKSPPAGEAGSYMMPIVPCPTPYAYRNKVCFAYLYTESALLRVSFVGVQPLSCESWFLYSQVSFFLGNDMGAHGASLILPCSLESNCETNTRRMC